MNILAIINPASGAGRTGRRLPEIESLLSQRFGAGLKVHVTKAKGDAQNAANAAGGRGCEYVVAVGGDGTIQEIVNGLMACGSKQRSACTIGILNTGTGCGLAQSLGLPGGLGAQIDVFMRGETRVLDVGKVTHGQNGSEATRYFVNECQVGFGAAVTARVEKHNKRLGGFLNYGHAALKEIVGCSAENIKWRADKGAARTTRLLGVIVANGSTAGGGMRLAPHAHLDDGMLDVILLHDQPAFSRLKTFPRIYWGTHLTSPHIQYFQSQTLELSSEAVVPLSADGEPLGQLPCHIEIIPGALRASVPSSDRSASK